MRVEDTELAVVCVYMFACECMSVHVCVYMCTRVFVLYLTTFLGGSLLCS